MREFLKRTKIVTASWAVLMIILGVLLVIEPTGVMLAVSELIGLIILCAGIFILIMFLSGRGKEEGIRSSSVAAIFGAILLAVGLYIVLYPKAIIEFVTILIAIILFMHGIYDILESRLLQTYGNSHWYVSVISAAVKFLIAILIIMKPLGLASMITVFAGISMILAGISGLVLNHRVRQWGKYYKQRTKEASFYSVREEEQPDVVDGELLSEESIDR